MIDLYADEMNQRAAAINGEHYESAYFREEPELIHSMNEIEGWQNG